MAKTPVPPALRNDPAPATSATPVIRRIQGAECSRSLRIAKTHLPAWVISSALHVALISFLILVFGLSQTDAAPSDKIIITTVSAPIPDDAPNEDENVDYDLQLDVSTDALQIEQQIVEEKVTTDPLASSSMNALDNLPSVLGTANDKSLAGPDGLNGAMTGSGDVDGLQAFINGAGSGGTGTGQAMFFGTAAKGTRFAIIADNSNSMKGRPMELLKFEMINTLTKARGATQFYLSFFNRDANPQPIRRWVPVTARVDLNTLTTWIRNIGTYNGTVPITGFENVFAIQPPPDVIYFMTDGGFNPKEVQRIKQLNMSLKKPAVIHTIAFKDRRGEALLRQIALDSKGTFRFVALP